jgi:hypothetical protein
MQINTSRPLADQYEVTVTAAGYGIYTVLLPGGITKTLSAAGTAAAAALALGWFTGLDADECSEGDMEYLGTFGTSAHYRFTV